MASAGKSRALKTEQQKLEAAVEGGFVNDEKGGFTNELRRTGYRKTLPDPKPKVTKK